jgi:hypothetical protein
VVHSICASLEAAAKLTQLSHHGAPIRFRLQQLALASHAAQGLANANWTKVFNRLLPRSESRTILVDGDAAHGDEDVMCDLVEEHPLRVPTEALGSAEAAFAKVRVEEGPNQ